MNFVRTILAIFIAAFFLADFLAEGQPQRNSQRGRAISGFNRGNDADYDDSEDDGPPRKYGRKGYRSNCRCAKLSNCPKIQITIPRCPPEEWVCCYT